MMLAFLCLGTGPAPNAVKGPSEIAAANNKFAFDLYGDLRKSEKGKNLFISPYSISTALAMTYEGADKATADQMRKVFYFSANRDALRQGCSSLIQSINQGSKYYELSTANSLWPQAGYGFSKDYLGAIKKYYGGNAEEVNYSGNKADAIQKINAWTAKNTKDKIPEIVTPDDITELTRMVLVNAIYFKGSWKSEFNPKQTRKSDFYNGNKKTPVDMMSNEERFPYAEIGDLQVLELPYAGGDLSMIVALPKGNDPSKLESSLSYGDFQKWLGALSEEKVRVALPKFKIHCLYSLNSPLIHLGMPLAFDERQADFSKMTGKKDLYISDVIHATFVDVNEKGTEAAGATAVVMSTKSLDLSPDFTANHPFLFFIYDKKAGAILFMGKITEPTVEAAKK